MGVVRTLAALAAGLALLSGCSRSRPPAEAQPTVTMLQDVDALLRASGGVNRVPNGLGDLGRRQSMFPRGYEAVKSGDVIVLWGSPLKGEGDAGKAEAIIAYEKNVPDSGGYVLLSAGTVKKMSADEFRAAPKAGK
jgi:hypothetical protein